MNKTTESEVRTTPEEGKAAQADPMAQFMIRGKANAPHRTYLFNPATKEETPHYLDIVSAMSDDFREARDDAMRRAAVIAAVPHEETRKAQARESQLQMYASLVKGWSFDKPCTPANIVEFIREAPQIQNLIVTVADEGEYFFNNA